MKYTEKDFTQWHDGKTKPVHEGVYEKDVERPGIFQYWNGLGWCGWALTVTGALANSDFFSSDQTSPWRGLRIKPKG